MNSFAWFSFKFKHQVSAKKSRDTSHLNPNAPTNILRFFFENVTTLILYLECLQKGVSFFDLL